MKILHIGQMIGGLDIYIRNSIVYNKEKDNEYVIVCGKDDKHQPVIRNGVEVKEYPISLFRSLNPVNDLKALITAKVEADQALVKKKSAEWKAIMEGMSFNAFLLFHSKMNELMKTKKATLVKYGFLASEMLDNHKRYWASSYYWHNKKYDEYEYKTFRKQTEIIVTIFYEGILRGTQYGNHPRTKYALKIHRIIEDLMNKDWSKVNETLK